MPLLYEKRGRRYYPHTLTWERDRDRLRVGGFRLTHCYAEGALRYEYDVTPMSAPWVAAAMLAKQGIRDAIHAAARARPSPPAIPYTARELEVIERVRNIFAAEGIAMPSWWQHASAEELADAAIAAVEAAT